MAANMAAKTDFIDISGDNDAIIKNKVPKPMFWGSRNLQKLNITTKELSFSRWQPIWWLKTEFNDISSDNDAIIENKVSQPMFSGSRNSKKKI